MVAPRGSTDAPSRRSVGIQYAAVSPGRWHVDEPESKVPRVENAFVVVFPTKLWSCDAPGRRGNTIGSSISRWLNLQVLTKFTPWSAFTLAAAGPGAAPVPAGAMIANPIRT